MMDNRSYLRWYLLLSLSYSTTHGTFCEKICLVKEHRCRSYLEHNWGIVGQVRGDEAHFIFCAFEPPSGHFGPKLTAWDRLGLFRTILERYGPFLTIFDQFWTILDLIDHFGPVGPKWPK